MFWNWNYPSYLKHRGYVLGTETCGECGTESGRLCARCQTCDKSLCETCEQQHKDDDNLSGHELVSIPTCSVTSESEESTLVCPNHHGNSLQVNFLFHKMSEEKKCILKNSSFKKIKKYST